MNSVGLLYCVLTAFCWAIGPVFLRKSLDCFDNTEINALRSIGFVSVAAAVCLLLKPSLIVWSYGLPLLGFVVFLTIIGNVIGDLCYFVSIDNIGVGRAIATSNSYPILIGIFSFLWLGETPSVRLWIGTAIIIVGLALLNLTKKNTGPKTVGSGNGALGFATGICASTCWAIMIAAQKWIITTYKPEPASLTLWRAIALSFIAWGVWYFRKNREERSRIFKIGMKKWVSPFMAGAFGLALGGVFFASALEIVPVSAASPITAANPIIAAIIAKFAFKEKLSPLQWVGILMVIIGGIEVSA